MQITTHDEGFGTEETLERPKISLTLFAAISTLDWNSPTQTMTALDRTTWTAGPSLTKAFFAGTCARPHLDILLSPCCDLSSRRKGPSLRCAGDLNDRPRMVDVGPTDLGRVCSSW